MVADQVRGVVRLPAAVGEERLDAAGVETDTDRVLQALPVGEQLLVGVTARGVVTARLPAITNIYQARAWGAPAR